MKKLFVLFISLFVFMFSVGCANSFSLDNYVCELRSDIFEGQSQSFSLKVAYGFRKKLSETNESHFETVHGLTFKLLDCETSNTEYSVSYLVNGETKKSVFSLNPISHSLTAFIEIENFSLKEFNVDIVAGSKKETITLKSILLETTISYHDALKHLYNQQTDLINSYIDENGRFNGEIIARVIVKEDNSYWYIGLLRDNQLKAMLIDGTNGEILAIREIM